MANQTPSSAIRPHFEKIAETHGPIPVHDGRQAADPINYALKPEGSPGTPIRPREEPRVPPYLRQAK